MDAWLYCFTFLEYVGKHRGDFLICCLRYWRVNVVTDSTLIPMPGHLLSVSINSWLTFWILFMWYTCVLYWLMVVFVDVCPHSRVGMYSSFAFLNSSTVIKVCAVYIHHLTLISLLTNKVCLWFTFLKYLHSFFLLYLADISCWSCYVMSTFSLNISVFYSCCVKICAANVSISG